MASLFQYSEDLVLDPPLNPCCASPFDSPSFPGGSSDHPKPDLRSSLDLATPCLFKSPASEVTQFDPSPSGLSPTSVCINHRELLDLWLQKFHSLGNGSSYDASVSSCPDLKKGIEGILSRASSDKFVEYEGGDSCSFLKLYAAMMPARTGHNQRDAGSLSDMLTWLMEAAIRPGHLMTLEGNQERPEQVLKARKKLQVAVPDEVLAELHQPPRRRSERLKEKDNTVGTPKPQKRIPIGSDFQADLPDWQGPEKSNEPDDAMRMGTSVWPTEGNGGNHDESMIGTGRDSIICVCTSPGSVECIRLHVELSRVLLKSELGPAFFSLGMDQMGEEVSESWTHEEMMEFDALVRENPESEGKSFMKAAFKEFPSKSQQSIVSYYYNVFVPTRMSNQTRLPSSIIDSENEEEFDEARKAKYLRNTPQKVLDEEIFK